MRVGTKTFFTGTLKPPCVDDAGCWKVGGGARGQGGGDGEQQDYFGHHCVVKNVARVVCLDIQMPG